MSAHTCTKMATAVGFYADSLRRLLRRNGANAGVGIKTAFGAQAPLRKVRQFAKRVFMVVPLGDRLMAFAQEWQSYR